MAQLTLEAIRRPVPLRRETDTGEPISDPLRIIMRKELADPLVDHWKKRFVPEVKFHVSADTSDRPEAPVIVSVSGASFQDLEGSIDGLFEFPVVCIPAGEEGDFANIRRARLEDGPRAYDVSSILAGAQRWIAPPGAVGSISLKEKREALEVLIRQRDGDAWLFDPTESSPIAFWNGLLIVRQDPAVHRHLLKFLEHLQRTGRPDDPPPEQ